jgi:hypothetical protein
MADVITEPTSDDWTWLDQAEQKALGILRSHYGDVELVRDVPDLAWAQRLIDDHLISAHEELTFQRLGAVLGNVFEANTSMRWARVRNEFGDMLALHSYAIGFTLYPLSMVAKRVQDGRQVDIPGLYRSFVADLKL